MMQRKIAVVLLLILLAGAAARAEAKPAQWSGEIPGAVTEVAQSEFESVGYFPMVLGPVVHPDLFPHGVASGDVGESGLVLWTRTPAPLAVLDISTQPDFRTFAYSTSFTPTLTSDYTLKAEVTDLQPGTTYFYRWRTYGPSSPTGTFRTAPTSAATAALHFAFSGDSDGTRVDGQPVYNNFEALDAVRAENPDFFIYLGDTIYADSGHRPAPAETLEAYWDAYKTNRQIPALRNLLAATSIYAVWDDHEIYNDYAGQSVDPARYAAGRRAFLDYMPVPELGALSDDACAGDSLFHVEHWGAQADLIFLDTRSCRSEAVLAACTPAGSQMPDLAPMLPAATRLGVGLPASPPFGCRDAINDPARTLLGSTQLAAFKQALQDSTAKTKFVITSVPIQQLYLLPYDRWEGYGAERAEILDFIRTENIENVIFLAADLHANLQNEVFLDLFTDPDPIAYEFVTGPIAANTFEDAILDLGGQQVLDGVNLLFSLLGMDCRQFDTYSYGSVSVDAGAGATTITLKDDAGTPLTDALNSATCTKTFGP